MEINQYKQLIDDLRKRYSLFSVEEYESGEMIFAQGDLADRLYIIQSGEVEVLRTTDDKEVLLVGAGDMAQETVRYLLAQGARKITVVNRSPERAARRHRSAPVRERGSSPCRA